MRVAVYRITDQPYTLQDVCPGEDFPVLRSWAKAREGRITAPLNISLILRRTGKLIEVSGRLQTRLELVCRRCLNSYDWPLSFDCRFYCAPQSEAESTLKLKKEMELDGEDIGHYEYSGEELDLRQAIGEEVLAALPAYPLCRPDCRGLCPHCGAAIQDQPCTCNRPDTDPRWTALAKLKK